MRKSGVSLPPYAMCMLTTHCSNVAPRPAALSSVSALCAGFPSRTRPSARTESADASHEYGE